MSIESYSVRSSAKTIKQQIDMISQCNDVCRKIESNRGDFEKALLEEKCKFFDRCRNLDGYNESLDFEIESAWDMYEKELRKQYDTMVVSLQRKVTKSKSKAYVVIILIVVLFIVVMIVGQYAKYGGF